MGIQKTALESSHAHDKQASPRRSFVKRREDILAEGLADAKGKSAKAMNCHICKDNSRCYYSMLSNEVKPIWIAARKELNVKKEETVFTSGEKPIGVFVVCSGNVAIEKQYRNGETIIAHVAGHGEMIGDRAFCAEGMYWEDAMAISHSKVVFIEKKDFETILSLEPHLVRMLLKVRSRELGTAEKKAVMIAHEKVDNKVIITLAKNADENFVVKVTRTMLANMTGMCLETFIRQLKKLEDNGMIKRTPASITLTDKFVKWYREKWFATHQKTNLDKK